MTRASLVCDRLLESEADADDDVKDFILSQAREDKPSDELVDFGLAFDTNSTYEIKANLRELRLDPNDHDIWNQLSADINRLERNAQSIWEEHGLGLRLEGHTGYSVIGTAWVKPGSSAWDWLMRVTDYDPSGNDEPWSTSSGSIWHLEKGATHKFYDGVSELGQRVLDLSIHLFDLEKLERAVADHARLVRND